MCAVVWGRCVVCGVCAHVCVQCVCVACVCVCVHLEVHTGEEKLLVAGVDNGGSV